MMPYLVKFGSIEIRYYSIMYLIGILIGIYMTRKRAAELGYNKDLVENILIVGFITGLFGARAYYVVMQWDIYKHNPLEVFAIWHGGLAIHGGVIGGALGVILYSMYHKISAWFATDNIAPWLLLAQGLGRIGNFTNGEAHGVPTITPPEIIFRAKPAFEQFWAKTLQTLNLQNTPESVSQIYNIIQHKTVVINFEGKDYILREYFPWGVSFPSTFMPPAYLDFGTLPVHPTFFYEMILNFIGFFILYYFWRQNKYMSVGVISGIYLIAYGVIRASVTYFRADDLMVGFLRAPHLASIGFVLFGLFLLYQGLQKVKRGGVHK